MLADRARQEQWSYERFAEILLGTEVSARESHGGDSRIKAARFPARKTLDEFDFTFQRSLKKTVVEHLGQLEFLHARQNVILLGPPGTGKPNGRSRCRFARASPASESSSRPPPSGSPASPKPNAKTPRDRTTAAVVHPAAGDRQVGYILFDPEAASLVFSLVSNRYERASMIVTSNKPFPAWGDIFVDDMATRQ